MFDLRKSKARVFRRTVLALGMGLAAGVMAGAPGAVQAAGKSITIGITFPVTGADAKEAQLHVDGALMAIAEANEKGGVAGYHIKSIVLNNATSTAGQYDPAQAATNAKKLVSDPNVVVNIGPEMSGSGKAMSPIFSQANMATITPTSTNPDITSNNPRFMAQFRPNGKAVYFRTVTTDAYQGPNMANFYKETLHAKSVYILDDSGTYGVGLADAFERQAKKIGLKVVGRDRLNPRDADYTVILTKIKGLHPDSLYYGGVGEAGVKLIKQAYDVLPHSMIKGGGDGIFGSDILTGAGFPAAQGWYCTLAAPHLVAKGRLESWVKAFEKRYHKVPDDYVMTSYDATKVALHAIKVVAESGQEMNAANVRAAIQKTHLKTLQGVISFDSNGDLKNHIVSVYEMVHNPKYPLDDVIHQYKYIGVAPQS